MHSMLSIVSFLFRCLSLLGVLFAANAFVKGAVRQLTIQTLGAHRLTNRWSAAKGNTKYAFDPVGNLTNIDYPSSTDVRFKYDWLDRVTNMVDAAGTTAYAYNSGGRLWTEDGPFASDTLTNVYSYGLRTSLSLQQPTGFWTNAFGYDASGRLTNVTSPAGAFNYAYDPNRIALLNKLSLPNTAYITNVFDAMARLTGTYLRSNNNGTIDSYVYAYNPASQRTNLARADASTVAFSYDNIGQLKAADSSVATEDRGYFYDSAWNLNYRTNNGALTTHLLDVKNQLTNATGAGNLTYDSNGNLTGVGGWKFFTYDDENRLVRMETYSGGDPTGMTEWVYDGLGRLRQRLEYGYSFPSYYLTDDVRFVYDGWRVIQERNSIGTPLARYTRGRDLSGSLEGAGGIGGLLARSHGYASGEATAHNFYFADGNGNVVRMVSTNQAVVASYRYDPFGNLISSGGSLAGANLYRFSSKPVHLGSGLYYYGYRFYDPNLQRWLNRDPIEEDGGINLYGYVDNDPLGRADPFGLDGTNDPSKVVEKVARETKKAADCAKQVCKERMNQPLGKRGPLPGSAAGGAARAVGGTVVQAGTGVLEAGPGIITVAAIAKACSKCKECRGDPAIECDPEASRDCDKACDYCEKYKDKAGKVAKKL
jgi:RHS repeat-associated protein